MNVPDWIVAHARRQQRHFRWAQWAHRWVPRRWRARASAAVGRHFSPELPDAVKIWSALQQLSGCNDGEAHRWLANWYANQGAMAVELHDYPQLTRAWARDQVDCDRRDLLAAVADKGGLVLTYHSFHHNRLGAFLGLSGAKVWGIAATEENSLWKPWTGRWVRLINGGSEAWFGGGRYLFTDQMRQLLRDSRAALSRGETVVNLCDNPSDSPTAVPVDCAGRRLSIATGMIDLALELGVPVTYAIFYSDLAGGHRCRLAPGVPGATAAQIANDYVQHVLRWTREDLHAWQGLLWWDELPLMASAPQGFEAWHATAAARFAASRPKPSWQSRCLQWLGAIELRLSPPRP